MDIMWRQLSQSATAYKLNEKIFDEIYYQYADLNMEYVKTALLKNVELHKSSQDIHQVKATKQQNI